MSTTTGSPLSPPSRRPPPLTTSPRKLPRSTRKARPPRPDARQAATPTHDNQPQAVSTQPADERSRQRRTLDSRNNDLRHIISTNTSHTDRHDNINIGDRAHRERRDASVRKRRMCRTGASWNPDHPLIAYPTRLRTYHMRHFGDNRRCNANRHIIYKQPRRPSAVINFRPTTHYHVRIRNTGDPQEVDTGNTIDTHSPGSED